MKIFVSADIEGTTGICHWDETEYPKKDYDYFRRQMSREVAAACEGALDAGAQEILVKDAHEDGRNILPDMLPEKARLFRSWAKDPLSMMACLDETFDGVVFTGYHSGAEMTGNPLSHTMNTKTNYVKLNGDYCPELYLNSLTASMFGVPVRCVAGDRGLCEWMNRHCPGTLTVPVNEGSGYGSLSIHPDVAVARIRETVRESLKLPKADCLFPMPESFRLECSFKQHYDAKAAGFYPGCRQTGPRTVEMETKDYTNILKFVFWVL